MAEDNSLTLQGNGCPVSAAGQGEQAGPQASSSSDRSPILMDSLVSIGYNATRSGKNFSAKHICTKNVQSFCYICAKYEVKSRQRRISKSIKSLYKAYFGVEMENLNTSFVPNIICGSCYSMLRKDKSKKSPADIAVPAVWTQPLSEDECYFCANKIVGLNSSTRQSHNYANVPTLKKPIKVGDQSIELAGPSKDLDLTPTPNCVTFTSNTESEESNSPSDDTHASDSEEEITQAELNDLVRDLGLPKDGSEYLASWLKKRKKIGPQVKISYYRDRDKEFRQFFEYDKDLSLVFCNNVEGLINAIKPNCYVKDQWRLFIDSSSRSLKCVLLHNTNVFAPVPIAHSIVTKEEYDKLDAILQKIEYRRHKWQICGDFKIITILLGQQSGNTLYPCFICEWNSRDRIQHYKKKHWPKRLSLTPGEKNIKAKNLVDPKDVLLPPLHIKLGIIKQFVTKLDKDGATFNYIRQKFPYVSEAKLSAGVFDGPQIRTLIKDENFAKVMNDIEKKAWTSFVAVVKNFLGNHKSPHYKKIVADMVQNFGEMQCNMSLKIHFLHSHLDVFPKVLGHYSEEQGERFHQDIKEMERRYQGRWDINMLADFCWTLKREVAPKNRKRTRMPLHRSFESKRSRYHAKSIYASAFLSISILILCIFMLLCFLLL